MRLHAILAVLLVASCSEPAPKMQSTDAYLNAPPTGCERTEVEAVTSRLKDDPDSGTGIVYKNGVTGFGYEVAPAILASRPGDKVMLCLVKQPRPSECPPDAIVSRVFHATNERTGREWELSEASHIC